MSDTTSPGPNHRLCSYRVVVDGAVGRAVLAELDRFAVETRGAHTVLWGEHADQADLFGLLRRLERLGIDLVSIEKVPRAD